MRRLILTITFLAGFAAMTAHPAQAQTTTVEATGIAYVASAQDYESARRRALGDALVSAAMAGGATISGHTAVVNGRVTADITMMQMAGRIVSYQLLSAAEQGGQWQVQIRAEVGAAATGRCATLRRLTISSLPPVIDVRPDVPAWAVPVAGQLAHDVTRILQAHPATVLDSVAPMPVLSAPAALDYTSLTQGHAAQPAGNHRLAQTITVQRQGNQLLLTLDIGLAGSDGETLARRFQRQAAMPQAGTVGYLTGQGRDRAEHNLTAGLIQDVTAAIDAIACQPPQARMTLGNAGLQVPIGAVHGLTRGSLALLFGSSDRFGLLEIAQLGDRDAILRPLDPTIAVADLHGGLVYFIEAGL